MPKPLATANSFLALAFKSALATLFSTAALSPCSIASIVKPFMFTTPTRPLGVFTIVRLGASALSSNWLYATATTDLAASS